MAMNPVIFKEIIDRIKAGKFWHANYGAFNGSLDLRNQNLSTDQVIELAELLSKPEYMRNVKWLSLDNCNIGDQAAIALATMLQSNKYLRTLSLEQNPIGNRGGLAILAALEQNEDALEVVVLGTKIEDTIREKIARKSWLRVLGLKTTEQTYNRVHAGYLGRFKSFLNDYYDLRQMARLLSTGYEGRVVPVNIPQDDAGAEFCFNRSDEIADTVIGKKAGAERFVPRKVVESKDAAEKSFITKMQDLVRSEAYSSLLAREEAEELAHELEVARKRDEAHALEWLRNYERLNAAEIKAHAESDARNLNGAYTLHELSRYLKLVDNGNDYVDQKFQEELDAEFKKILETAARDKKYYADLQAQFEREVADSARLEAEEVAQAEEERLQLAAENSEADRIEAEEEAEHQRFMDEMAAEEAEDRRIEAERAAEKENYLNGLVKACKRTVELVKDTEDEDLSDNDLADNDNDVEVNVGIGVICGLGGGPKREERCESPDSHRDDVVFVKDTVHAAVAPVAAVTPELATAVPVGAGAVAVAPATADPVNIIESAEKITEKPRLLVAAFELDKDRQELGRGLSVSKPRVANVKQSEGGKCSLM